MSSAKSRKRGLALIVERFIYIAPLAILSGILWAHLSRTLKIGMILLWILYIAIDFFLWPWFVRTFLVKKK